MKSIRKGNDITIKWFLSIDNGRTALATADITVYLIDAWGKKTAMPITKKTNYVEMKYYGIQQGKLGVYRLTAILNEGEIGQAVVDECEVFRLVDCSHMEEGDDNQNLNTETVSVTSSLSVGIKGASAYEIWLNNGHEGTEADFLDWLQNKGDLEELQAKVDAINGVGDTTDAIDTLPEVVAAMAGMKAGDTVKETVEESTEPLDEAEMSSLMNLFPTS